MKETFFYTETKRHHFDAVVERELDTMAVPLGAVVVITDAKLVCGVKRQGEETSRWGWFYTEGWDGSYHDGHWYPRLVAWAAGPHRLGRARRAMKKARAWYETQPKTDTAVFRFKTRMMVREGD